MKRELKNKIRNVLNRRKEFSLCCKEFRANNRNQKNNDVALKRSILLAVHSIEKGMGVRNSEAGHSQKDIKGLFENINLYIKRKYELDCFAIKEGLAAIREYIDYQKSFDGADLTFLKSIENDYNILLSKIPQKVIDDSKEFEVGVTIFDERKVNDYNSFDEFVRNRHSIRMYKKAPVAKKKIFNAVDIANYAPTACNRQANKVYFTNDAQKAMQIDKLITGNKGFEHEIQNYILVTADRTMFAGEEMFQYYTGGGYLSRVFSAGITFVRTCHMHNAMASVLQNRKGFKSSLSYS